MDINYELGDLKFVWDSEKAEKNLKKHKIKFENAVMVFLDENRVEDYDEVHSDDEERIRIIGEVEKILVVICTERQEDYRIISARLANKQEKEIYYGQFSFI